TLLNDTVFFECAQALGRRIAEKSGSSADRIRFAFRVCLAREPSPRELDRLGRLHTDLLENARSNPPEAARLAGQDLPAGTSAADVAAWVGLGRALMNLDEFVTRE